MIPRQRRVGRRMGPGTPTPSSTKTWLVIALTVFLVAGAVGSLAWTQSRRVDLDTASLCPLSGPTGVHAVLLDQSDPITPLQAQRLSQVFDRLIDDASVGERIDLYVLTKDGVQALAPRLSICRPEATGNMFTENPKRIRERYLARFRQPLDDALKELMTPSPTESSPIMESIKAVCVAAFGGLPKGVPAHLTMASDMIQYSPVLNHYKERDFDVFAKNPASKNVLADCHRAGVDVLYLVRPKDARVQDRKHQLFWERFFNMDNASLNRMETI